MDKTSEKRVIKRSARTGTVDPRNAEVGAWIRQVRESKGLQQKPLSRAMGKPEHFLNRIEAGRQRISLIEIFDLLQAMGLQPDKSLQDLLEVMISDED